jgi:hypothetical protein
MLTVAVYVGINVGMILYDAPFTHFARDWDVWRRLRDALAQGRLYDGGSALPYLLSPLAAPLLAVQGALGPWFSVLLHVAAVAVIRRPLLIGLVLVSWGFWTDMVGGNTLTYAFVGGFLALREPGRWGLVYLAIFLLGPRMVEVPLAVWLLWRQPSLRLPGAALLAGNLLAVGVTGYLPAWIDTIASLGIPDWTIGPSRWLGPVWLLIGIPVGALLLARGRAGLAGLATSQYWVPQYFLMPLLDWFVPASEREASDSGGARQGANVPHSTGVTSTSP